MSNELQHALDVIAALDEEQWGDRGFMGAREVANALGVEVSNLSWQKVEPIARISNGRIPVYLAADVRAEVERRKQ